MRSISLTEFKVKCEELIDEVAARRGAVTVTKQGKPYVVVSPPAFVIGKYAEDSRIAGDIVVPLEAEWEVLQ